MAPCLIFIINETYPESLSFDVRIHRWLQIAPMGRFEIANKPFTPTAVGYPGKEPRSSVIRKKHSISIQRVHDDSIITGELADVDRRL